MIARVTTSRIGMLAAVFTGCCYGMATFAVFLAVLLGVRYGEQFRHPDEPWSSWPALVRNAEAVWPTFALFALLVLLPAALLGWLAARRDGSTMWRRHGVAFGATFVLAFAWQAIAARWVPLALLPAAALGLILTAGTQWLWLKVVNRSLLRTP